MARESFFYPETGKLLALLDEAARRSSVSRGQAFEDFLHMSVCALSGGAMEDEYLDVVKKHSSGKQGKRGCDSLGQLFGEMINAMEDARGELNDVLGDLFQGAITYGEAGQFLTPESLCRAIGSLSIGEDDVDNRESRTVFDPCCGSGRMLLAVAEQQRHWELIGQDIDLRCVRMTAINLALRNLYGYVLHGNSLGNTVKVGYRTGMNIRGGFIRYVHPGELAGRFADREAAASTAEPMVIPVPPDRGDGPGRQLELF